MQSNQAGPLFLPARYPRAFTLPRARPQLARFESPLLLGRELNVHGSGHAHAGEFGGDLNAPALESQQHLGIQIIIRVVPLRQRLC